MVDLVLAEPLDWRLLVVDFTLELGSLLLVRVGVRQRLLEVVLRLCTFTTASTMYSRLHGSLDNSVYVRYEVVLLSSL